MSEGHSFIHKALSYYTSYQNVSTVTNWALNLVTFPLIIFYYLNLSIDKLVLPLSNAATNTRPTTTLIIITRAVSGFFIGWYFVPEYIIVSALLYLEAHNYNIFFSKISYTPIRCIDTLLLIFYKNLFNYLQYLPQSYIKLFTYTRTNLINPLFTACDNIITYIKIYLVATLRVMEVIHLILPLIFTVIDGSIIVFYENIYTPFTYDLCNKSVDILKTKIYLVGTCILNFTDTTLKSILPSNEPAEACNYCSCGCFSCSECYKWLCSKKSNRDENRTLLLTNHTQTNQLQVSNISLPNTTIYRVDIPSIHNPLVTDSNLSIGYQNCNYKLDMLKDAGHINSVTNNTKGFNIEKTVNTNAANSKSIVVGTDPHSYINQSETLEELPTSNNFLVSNWVIVTRGTSIDVNPKYTTYIQNFHKNINKYVFDEYSGKLILSNEWGQVMLHRDAYLKDQLNPQNDSTGKVLGGCTSNNSSIGSESDNIFFREWGVGVPINNKLVGGKVMRYIPDEIKDLHVDQGTTAPPNMKFSGSNDSSLSSLNVFKCNMSNRSEGLSSNQRIWLENINSPHSSLWSGNDYTSSGSGWTGSMGSAWLPNNTSLGWDWSKARVDLGSKSPSYNSMYNSNIGSGYKPELAILGSVGVLGHTKNPEKITTTLESSKTLEYIMKHYNGKSQSNISSYTPCGKVEIPIGGKTSRYYFLDVINGTYAQDISIGGRHILTLDSIMCGFGYNGSGKHCNLFNNGLGYEINDILDRAKYMVNSSEVIDIIANCPNSKINLVDVNDKPTSNYINVAGLNAPDIKSFKVIRGREDSYGYIGGIEWFYDILW